jgi:hypothetical protein
MLISVLSAVHLLGFALGLEAATTKTVLLLRCGSNPDFIAAYLTVHRLITRVIVAGLLLLVLSGIGFLLAGMPLTGRLVAKLVLVAAIFALGPADRQRRRAPVRAIGSEARKFCLARVRERATPIHHPRDRSYSSLLCRNRALALPMKELGDSCIAGASADEVIR